MDRRSFIRAAGGLALAGVATQIPASGAEDQLAAVRTRPRVLIFEEPSFPQGEIPLPEKTRLIEALGGFDCIFAGLDDFQSRLAARDIDVVLTPYGSHFSKEAYGAFSAYLIAGGNWVNLGGIPLSLPVVRDGSAWRTETSTTAYHKKLGITQAFPVDGATIAAYRSSGLTEEPRLSAEEVFELYVRFTGTKDLPSEDGSAGPRDAVLRPAVSALGNRQELIAAPVVVIDRLQGPFAGGRWVLANFRGTIDVSAVRSFLTCAADGASELSARMSFACYLPGETPTVSVRFHRPGKAAQERAAGECQVEVYDNRRKLRELSFPLAGIGATVSADSGMDLAHLAPGFYEVRVSLPVLPATSNKPARLRYTTGFWIYDRSLLEQGTPFTAGEQYLVRDGVPYPVTGTTYMGSDVHRKFLLEPNPYVWDADFAAMRESGVNMVRTGIWTGWKNLMLDVGAPNEAAFRAMDAFVLTAKRHQIPLVMTFFAFLPESWGGLNPYLDPRSVAAQKEFVTLFARRYRMVPDLIWDLINEPSFCSPDHLWQCRPNYDAFEVAAWNSWLRERYPAATEAAERSRLQELYRAAADEPISLPALEEFDDANIFNDRRPIKVADYRLFAQEMFRRWVSEMAAVIRANGQKAQLVTVGQDEGGTYERPGNQFFCNEVDFTCLHNWWLNDHLLWDNVVTKAPGKLNLVEETGVMMYETIEGKAWRTEPEVANLLDRKMAIALGAGAAGFIEWVWNTNPFMALDNEAAIGFHRADGTPKPELASFRRYASFMAAHRKQLSHRAEADVLMVIPHSQMFSVRNYATEATQRSVRAMQYHCRVPMRAVSEYALNADHPGAKLVIVPSPRTLTGAAWTALAAMAERGSCVVLTGTFDRDDHFLLADRMQPLGVKAVSAPVMSEESLRIDGTSFRLNYRDDKMQRIEKAVVAGQDGPSVMTIERGKGKILWSPLPVELSEPVEPNVALYTYALKLAGIVPEFTMDEPDPSVLVSPTVFGDNVLLTLVSEGDRETVVSLLHSISGRRLSVALHPQKGTMLLLDRTKGTTLAALE